MPVDALKPQDVVLALKLLVHPERSFTQQQLASALRMSQSEVSMGLRRLARSRLYSAATARPIRAPLLEFLVHGVPYVFPASEGPVARGLPTAWSAKPLSDPLVVEQPVVWGGGAGDVLGRTIVPLSPGVPWAALEDPVLHESLALVEALRAGRARDRALARQHLGRRFKS